MFPKAYKKTHNQLHKMEAFRMHVSPSSTRSRKDYLANSGGTNVMAVLVRPCRSRSGRADTTPAGQVQLADVAV